jgi:hypothetical protein
MIGARVLHVERIYDIFERLPDGVMRWRASIAGHEAAILQLKESARSSGNEFQLMHLPTKTLIATMNAPNLGSSGDQG